MLAPQTVERLQNVIRVMKAVQVHDELRAKFNINSWFRSHPREVFRPRPHSLSEMQATQCGTTACAVGYCTLDAYFQERGLKLGETGIYISDGLRARAGYGAVTFFFDIKWGTAEILFSALGYHKLSTAITPQDVIDMIEVFLTFEDEDQFLSAFAV